MTPIKEKDLLRVMKEYFGMRHVLPQGKYHYSVRMGWCYEGQDLYIYDENADYYWRAHCSQEAIMAAHTFGDVYGKALTNLRDMVREHEKVFLKGY